MFRYLIKSTIQNIHKNKLNVKCITNIAENKKLTEKFDQQNIEFEKTEGFKKKRGIQVELIQTLEKLFGLPKAKAISLVHGDKIFRNVRIGQMSKVVRTLFDNGVKSDTILENHFVLVMSHDTLIAKLEIVKRINGNVNDFLPLLQLDKQKLTKIVGLMLNEAHYILEGNRIYHFSKSLNVEPKIVSKYFATHTFMLEMLLSNLLDNLNIFLKYNVQPMDMLRDLWAFQYKSSSIESRLKRAKDANKDKLMPWMVRCPEHVLQRSLNLSAETKELLKPYKSIESYIASRLNYDMETITYIISKHPSVVNVRVSKVKEILDYLLNEAGFTPHHIAQVPRILTHSLETTKERIDELKKLGCIPSSLVIVCKSRNEYQKFLNKWITIRESNKKSSAKDSSDNDSN